MYMRRDDWGSRLVTGSTISDRDDSRRVAAHDLVLALTLLLFFLPLMLVLVITIRLTSKGPIFFAHERLGQGGRSFHCLKFRTMVVDAEERLVSLLASDPEARAEWVRDHKLRHDPRITRIGVLLRKSSLDELPQLFNVLRGEMSLVGPRPIVTAERRFYGRYFAEYCSLRPGITGLWQVSGRNDVSYRRRVAFDVIYSRNRTAIMDLQIMAMTIPSVLASKGSY